MTQAEITQIIVNAGSQLLVVGTGLIAAYFQIRSKLDTRMSELKNHTDVTLQRLNGMLTYVIHSFDRPAWIKVARTRIDGEVEFRMLEINELYAAKFGIPRQSYLGKTDLEAGWDRKVADQFRSHDLSVWASGEPMTFTEMVNGQLTRFRKIRVQSPDGELKGVMGYAVDCQSPESCPYHPQSIPIP